MSSKTKTGSAAQPKWLLQLHRWCGLGALVFLLVAALSGSLLVYKQALIRWLIVDNTPLPASYSQIQIGAQLDQIKQLLGDDAGRTLIKVPSSDAPYWTLTRDTDKFTQLLNPENLRAYSDNLWLLPCLAFARELHTELFAGVVGEVILLLAGAMGLLLTLSGIYLWWPTKRGFHWRWVLPRQWKLAHMLHYHRHSGLVFAAFMLALLLTGSLMLWQKLRGPLVAPIVPKQSELATSNSTEISPLLSLAQAQFPDGWPTFIRLGSGENPQVNFRFRLPDEWHPNGRSSVKMDVAKSQQWVSARADQVGSVQRLVNQLYPLHSGYGMPWLYSLLVLMGGLALAWSCVTALLGYGRRMLKQQQQAKHQRPKGKV